jgi:hypothetical protein
MRENGHLDFRSDNSDYAYERSNFASSMLNGNVNTRLVGKVIMPVASNGKIISKHKSEVGIIIPKKSVNWIR